MNTVLSVMRGGRPEALFTKLLRIVWLKITGQLAMNPSHSLRNVVKERKTKGGKKWLHREEGERNTMKLYMVHDR